MKLYRGTTKELCEKYKREGIPPKKNFTNRLKSAKVWGKCIIEVEKNKNFEMKKDSQIFKTLKISDRDYQNTKKIKKFKIK